MAWECGVEVSSLFESEAVDTFSRAFDFLAFFSPPLHRAKDRTREPNLSAQRRT